MLQLLTRPRTALALLAAALVGLTLLACGGADPTATAAPTAAPQPTAVPTATPAPTATMPPPPTATSAPTPTATPRPTPTTPPTARPQPTPPPAPTEPPPTDTGMGMMPALPDFAPYQGTGYTIMVPEGWDEQTPSVAETVYQTVSENGVVASLTEVPLPPGLETGEEAADALVRFIEGGNLWDFPAMQQSREQMATRSGTPANFLIYLANDFSRTIFVLVPAITDFGLIAAYQAPLTENTADAEAALDITLRSFTSLEVGE